MTRTVPGIQTIQNLKTDENRRQQMASKQIQKSYERLSLIASKELMNLPKWNKRRYENRRSQIDDWKSGTHQRVWVEQLQSSWSLQINGTRTSARRCDFKQLGKHETWFLTPVDSKVQGILRSVSLISDRGAQMNEQCRFHHLRMPR